MNAKEFAHELEKAASFIRQQQALINQLEETQDYLYKTHDADKAEIEALKVFLKANELYLSYVEWRHAK